MTSFVVQIKLDNSLKLSALMLIVADVTWALSEHPGRDLDNSSKTKYQ